MKFKFKVGDKVRILDGSKIDYYTGGWAIAMKRYIGDIDTIKERVNNNGRPAYYLNEKPYVFDERGLELVVDKNETIVIYHKGNETIALDKRTGKKAVAKCHPDDTYDFDTGAKLAFERLMDVEPKKHTFKVGDIVTGNDNNHYNITNKDMTKGEVVKVSDDGLMIDVKIISHKWRKATSTIFHALDAKCFDLVEEKPTYYNGKIIFTKGDDTFKTGHIYEITDGQIKKPNSGFMMPTRGEKFRSIDDVVKFFDEHTKNGWADETLELMEVIDD